jgi:hypothetical protein
MDIPPYGPRKVAKLAGYGDGGFALLAPYLPQPSDWLLMQTPRDYSQSGTFHVGDESMYRRFRSARGVKLSAHGDGFVQFSNEDEGGILSGRDKETGEPRGFGYDSFAPGDLYVRSGPYCGVFGWGLENWESATSGVPDAVTITSDDLYYQYPDSPPRDPPAFAFEFWVLPRQALIQSRPQHGHWVAEMPPHRFYAMTDMVELIVIDLGGSYVLGLVVTRASHGFPWPAGATIGAPSDRTQTMGMLAMSPPPPDDSSESGDYRPDVNSLPIRDTVRPLVFDKPGLELQRPWGRKRGPA